MESNQEKLNAPLILGIIVLSGYSSFTFLSWCVSLV